MAEFNYVYRISNIKKDKHYYGTRTCRNKLPQEDIGIIYFSSSKDKEFINEQKEKPQYYKYKVIGSFNTREDALKLEIKLHDKFNVGINKKFYNKSKQTSTGFDTTGIKKSKAFKQNISNKNKGYVPTNEHRNKIAKALKGKKKTEEHKKNVSANTDNKGSKHPRFKGYYITPIGKFDSPGGLVPLLTLTQLKHYCNNNDRKISKNAYNKSEFLKKEYSFEEVKNKTYKDLGFYKSDT